MADTPTGDWPTQVADTVERLVGTVRERATGPAVTAMRAIVFALLIGLLGVTAVVLLAIAFERFLTSYLPGTVWVAHLITGLLFLGAGILLFSKRQRPLED